MAVVIDMSAARRERKREARRHVAMVRALRDARTADPGGEFHDIVSAAAALLRDNPDFRGEFRELA